MNIAIFSCARLAYNFGVISPNNKMINVINITCMINPKIGFEEKSNALLIRWLDMMAIPTFTKLLVIKMVDSRRLGFL